MLTSTTNSLVLVVLISQDTFLGLLPATGERQGGVLHQTGADTSQGAGDHSAGGGKKLGEAFGKKGRETV